MHSFYPGVLNDTHLNDTDLNDTDLDDTDLNETDVDVAFLLNRHPPI